MQPDEKYRAFLLGMADEGTQADIEEGILDGRIEPDQLHLVEEDLIDDFLFGRLSAVEKQGFTSEFLSAPERAQRVEFTSVLKSYAAQRAPGFGRQLALPKPRGLVPLTLRFLLAGALGCAVLAAMWLGESDLHLRRELAQATRENDEHQRLIASLLTDHEERASKSSASNELPSHVASQESTQPDIRLTPGVSRGLVTVPVLHLNHRASTVSIILELPFSPLSPLHEELLSSEDKAIWSQEFSAPGAVSSPGITTIVLPAALLTTGEYRLRVEDRGSGEGSGDTATYLFRVRKD